MNYLIESLTGYVIASVLNVRGGRGISHPILKQIRKRNPLVLYGLKDGWWETPIGYVSADWISYAKAADPVVVKAKVGALRYGTKVKIYEQSGSWYRIGSNKWVSVSYIK